MRTDFVLGALERALHERRPAEKSLIHHSGRGAQYVLIRYSERLATAKIAPSVGSVGDSYDNALAETINGLYKSEVIHRRSWPTGEAVELATLIWVDCFNHRRQLSWIGNIPPAEADCYAKAAEQKQAAWLTPNSLLDSRQGPWMRVLASKCKLRLNSGQFMSQRSYAEFNFLCESSLVARLE
jgi:hypothetical protein